MNLDRYFRTLGISDTKDIKSIKRAFMKVAKKYGKEYWDGHRRRGYGGYTCNPGRWKPIVEQLITLYGLNDKSKIIDLGCGKGYLYEN